MTDDRVERRLAAILSSDVVGYSRMMEADETGTLRRLEAHRRDLIDPTIAAHAGRIVKLMGDGALVEFASAVDAVRCAVEVQLATLTCNANVPTEQKLEFRIGINLGDIIVRGEDIYGDGVNVAARLEGLAEPGGICISRSVRDQVRDKLDCRFEDLGDVEIKNIARPVRVFRVLLRDNPALKAPAQSKSTVTAASEGPSIVVLPFNNISGDPEQEYFSDGISEDIITDLSKVPGLLVIARNSAFAFKGKAINVADVCKQFRVKYALEGSVRKAGQRVRITAQLIDGASGGHLWAERYDRLLTDIFDLQDELTREIVSALKLKLGKADPARLSNAGTRSVEAHDCYLRGRECFHATNYQREGANQAAIWFRRAIELDPGYVGGYGGLTQVYLLEHQNHWGADPKEALKSARRFADEALARDQNDAFIHYVGALVAMFEKDFERWQKETDAALALNPSFALALNSRGVFFFADGEPLKAVPFIEKAIRADPAFRQFYLHFLGMAYLLGG